MFEFDLDNIFSYHKASQEDERHYEALRQAAYSMAYCVLKHTPAVADQSTAIRKIREAVMTANAAVALKGQLFK